MSTEFTPFYAPNASHVVQRPLTGTLYLPAAESCALKTSLSQLEMLVGRYESEVKTDSPNPEILEECRAEFWNSHVNQAFCLVRLQMHGVIVTPSLAKKTAIALINQAGLSPVRVEVVQAWLVEAEGLVTSTREAGTMFPLKCGTLTIPRRSIPPTALSGSPAPASPPGGSGGGRHVAPWPFLP
jgi:hypothetical protein